MINHNNILGLIAIKNFMDLYHPPSQTVHTEISAGAGVSTLYNTAEHKKSGMTVYGEKCMFWKQSMYMKDKQKEKET